MKITKPGLYFDVPTDAYFADPCPSPSLTQSVAKLLIDRSPRHAWQAHPKLNPDWKADDDRKFDVGNIAHALMIGRGKSIVVLDGFDDWRTKAAKEKRDEAAAEGKLAVLGKHFALADRMTRSAREQLDQRGLAHLFEKGNGEVVLAWCEDDIWLRQMVDWLTPALDTFIDFKTTDMSAAPHGLPRMMVNAGWPIQAAMAERGLDALDAQNAGRRQFLFVVQETEPPYLLNVVRISEYALTMGRKQLQYAVDIWRRCFAENRWPGYPSEIIVPDYPNWHENAWLEREVAESYRDEPARRREPMLTDLAGG